MKTIKSFTDQELIDELRNRNYVMDIWSINDVDEVIDEVREEQPEAAGDLGLSEYDKLKILKDLYEDNDKQDDFNMIKEKVIEKWNSIEPN